MAHTCIGLTHVARSFKTCHLAAPLVLARILHNIVDVGKLFVCHAAEKLSVVPPAHRAVSVAGGPVFDTDTAKYRGLAATTKKCCFSKGDKVILRQIAQSTYYFKSCFSNSSILVILLLVTHRMFSPVQVSDFYIYCYNPSRLNLGFWVFDLTDHLNLFN
jgi:hypothetical protein